MDGYAPGLARFSSTIRRRPQKGLEQSLPEVTGALLQIESRRAGVAAAAEMRGGEVEPAERVLGAEAGLHSPVGPFLDQHADVDAVDAAREVDQALRVLGRRARGLKYAQRQRSDADAPVAFQRERRQELLEEPELPRRLALVELVARLRGRGAPPNELARQDKRALRRRIEAELARVGDDAGEERGRGAGVDGDPLVYEEPGEYLARRGRAAVDDVRRGEAAVREVVVDVARRARKLCLMRSPARAWSAQSTKTASVSFGSSIASSAPTNVMPRAANARRRGTGSGFTQTEGEPLAVSTRASATCEPMQSPSGLACPITATDRPATVLSSPWNASESSGKNLPMAWVGGRFGGQLVLNLVEGL